VNNCIDKHEVTNIIKKLPNGKAPGIDGITNEMLKCSAPFMVDYLVKMFKTIFESGIYPVNWGKAILMPLHKKGSLIDVGNITEVFLYCHL
jgi:hypothetical protein